jgi:hypothetical protein
LTDQSNNSLTNLNVLVEYLKPTLTRHGFRYEQGQNSCSSGGQFANGFFVNNKIRIGLIYRQNRLGLVNYESSVTNISHDMFCKALNKQSEQQLEYDSNGFSSYTLNHTETSKALLADLEEIILPYLDHATLDDIDSFIKKARNAIG